MESLTITFLDQGILGAIIVALAFVVIALYRQNQALQQEARDTLREVIPAITALDKALDSVQRGALK